MKPINNFNVRWQLFDDTVLTYDRTIIVDMICRLLRHGETCYYVGKQITPSEDCRQFTIESSGDIE